MGSWTEEVVDSQIVPTVIYTGGAIAPGNIARSVKLNLICSEGPTEVLSASFQDPYIYQFTFSSHLASPSPPVPTTVTYCNYCEDVCKGVNKCDTYALDTCVYIKTACGTSQAGYGIFKKDGTTTSLTMYPDCQCLMTPIQNHIGTCNSCLSNNFNGYSKC
ncbi:hypothetical protein SAMD00019534_018780 [Acytostelium subglobosum LB1]|uniref:hypothetical protein n=1 Tax=Acytostelium subglobosum LB1 TaxID=1410327 RepID=UPI000644BBEA|nr:hypothetical protein SAMD00019534_018780 [Acytostelium subglobosum LB1]GAM18703.1 hypothetical protein SAMD00019534_018780 [Acytostelium subglobosum LB1]|eukprot:XP_012757923.1 hypothetical protein SAMD00019534_018780 [Acytostelium subglobosum LB1]